MGHGHGGNIGFLGQHLTFEVGAVNSALYPASWIIADHDWLTYVDSSNFML
jgi:hypothetical protein